MFFANLFQTARLGDVVLVATTYTICILAFFAFFGLNAAIMWFATRTQPKPRQHVWYVAKKIVPDARWRRK